MVIAVSDSATSASNARVNSLNPTAPGATRMRLNNCASRCTSMAWGCVALNELPKFITPLLCVGFKLLGINCQTLPKERRFQRLAIADELQTFVGKKANKLWIWTAVNHKQAGILAWVVGYAKVQQPSSGCGRLSNAGTVSSTSPMAGRFIRCWLKRVTRLWVRPISHVSKERTQGWGIIWRDSIAKHSATPSRLKCWNVHCVYCSTIWNIAQFLWQLNSLLFQQRLQLWKRCPKHSIINSLDMLMLMWCIGF